MSLFGECSHIVIKSQSYIFHKQPEVIQEQLLNVEPEAAQEPLNSWGVSLCLSV